MKNKEIKWMITALVLLLCCLGVNSQDAPKKNYAEAERKETKVP